MWKTSSLLCLHNKKMCRTITVSNERYKITFVKHLEVRFALKGTKEKILVVFLKDLSESFFYKCGKREIFKMKSNF